MKVKAKTNFYFECKLKQGKPKNHRLLGRRQANLCFHFAGSGENLPDIAKSRDCSMGRKQNSFFFKPQVAIFQLRSSYKLQTYDQSVKEALWSQYRWINFNLSAGVHCQRDIKEAPLYECQRISA